MPAPIELAYLLIRHLSVSSSMHIIKVKGKAKIPDYIQLRDDDFVLIAYFRTDRPLKKMEKYGLGGKEEALKKVIERLPFGEIQFLNI